MKTGKGYAFWTSVLYILLFSGAQAAVAAVGSYALIPRLISQVMNILSNPYYYFDLYSLEGLFSELGPFIYAVITISDILAVAILLIYLSHKKYKTKEYLEITKPETKTVLMAVLLAFGYVIILMSILGKMPSDIMDSYAQSSSALASGDTSFGSIFMEVLAVVLVAPVSEEIFFRGAIYSRLREHFDLWPAVLICSALFGLQHFGLVWFSYTFVLSIILCLVREYYQSIVPCITIHMVFNLFGSFMGYLSLSKTANAVLLVSAIAAFAAGAVLFFANKKEHRPYLEALGIYEVKRSLFCTSCGAKSDGNSNFCSNCGHKL